MSGLPRKRWLQKNIDFCISECGLKSVWKHSWFSSGWNQVKTGRGLKTLVISKNSRITVSVIAGWKSVSNRVGLWWTSAPGIGTVGLGSRLKENNLSRVPILPRRWSTFCKSGVGSRVGKTFPGQSWSHVRRLQAPRFRRLQLVRGHRLGGSGRNPWRGCVH